MEVRFVAWLIWLIHLAFRQLTACLCMVHFFAQHTWRHEI